MSDFATPIESVDWDKAYQDWHLYLNNMPPGGEESRAHWNARVGRFLRKTGRSDYINQLIELLDLAPEDTVFDMGCGAGSLAVPLAKEGHDVIAVDFAEAMLEGLAQLAEEEGASGRIKTFQRSWQQDWSDLPVADVAISSRSFVSADLATTLPKLEKQARKRCVLSVGAGDRPFRDARIFEAMGRDAEAKVPPRELGLITNYLWANGRLPRVDYIEYPGFWSRDTREELEDAIGKTHAPQNEEQERLLAVFLEEHMTYDEDEGKWTLDYPRKDRWGVITWDVVS